MFLVNVKPLVGSRASFACLELLVGDLEAVAISREILNRLPFTPSGQLVRSFKINPSLERQFYFSNQVCRADVKVMETGK